ncbi:MAG: hypothetical protein AAFU79_14910 [Myxococcota bacterium]
MELYIRDAEEVFQGDPKGTTVDAEGHVSLGPQLRSMVAGSGRPVLSLARGHGRYLLGTAGAGLRGVSEGPKPVDRSLFEAKDLVISAVAAQRDQVWFATGPSGAVFSMEGDKAQPLFRPKATHVWALLPDRNGQVLAATGLPGAVLRVRKGRAATVFTVEEGHVRSLFRHPQRGLIAGGGEKGIVYALEGKEVRALYDSAFDEVTGFAAGPGGDLYACFLSGTKSGTLDPGTFVGPVGDDDASAESPFEGSEVVRIRADGEVDVLWTSKGEGALALAFDDASGHLFVATGTGRSGRARVYAVETQNRDRVVLLARIEAPMITGVQLDERGGLVLATAPDGGLLRLGPELRSKGEYVSIEQDLRRTARIGRTWFDAELPSGSRLEVQLRSGNTAKADATWSAWSKPVDAGLSGGDVALPPARYAQFRAVLRAAKTGQSPLLRSMHASVRRGNRRPEVRSVFPLKPGVYLRPLPSEQEREKTVTINGNALTELKTRSPVERDRKRARAGVEPGLRTVAWTTRDANGDRLLFSARLVDGQGTSIGLGENLETPYVTFDGRAVADGRYRAEITATDRPSNPPDEALQAAGRSEVFTIDNTPPVVERFSARTTGKGLQVMAKARDETSTLAWAEMSLDGGPWLLIPAADGLIDSAEERLELTVNDIGDLAGGKSPRVVKLRVEDALGNRVTAEAKLPQ